MADTQDELRYDSGERECVENYLKRIQLDIEQRAPELRWQRKNTNYLFLIVKIYSNTQEKEQKNTSK